VKKDAKEHREAEARGKIVRDAFERIPGATIKKIADEAQSSTTTLRRLMAGDLTVRVPTRLKFLGPLKLAYDHEADWFVRSLDIDPFDPAVIAQIRKLVKEEVSSLVEHELHGTVHAEQPAAASQDAPTRSATPQLPRQQQRGTGSPVV
jgi:hypothetical protein